MSVSRLRVPLVLLATTALVASLLAAPAGGQDEEQEPPRPAPELIVRGSGEGHGVGMSQLGARALARAGRAHTEILEHFYAGVTVGPHPAAQTADPVRVGLFHDNPAVEDPTVLRLSALRSDDGGAVDVRLAPDAAATRLPAGQIWTVVHDPGIPILRPPGFALHDADGDVVARGAGPATVEFAATGSPALRLPQIARSDDSLEGTLLRGVISLTRDEESGRFHPVLQIPLEAYLLGVDEMPVTWGTEALAAQAVVSRTIAARRVAAGLRDDCDCHVGVTAADQVYVGYAQEGDPQRGAWAAAVTGTAGQAVAVGGQLIEPVYAPAHGGRSENSEESWAFAGQAVPYLRSASDPWVNDPDLAAGYANASWEHGVEHDVLAELVGLATVAGVSVASRTIGGTPGVLSVSGWDADGERIEGRSFQGDSIGVAGADIFLALRARGDQPPSQQFGVIAFRDFPDVRSDSLHAYNVAAIADRGVTTGRADGTYNPRAGVRRDQMATFIARAFDLGERDDDRFTDVGGSVHRGRINAVAAAGVTAGCTADRYCPRLPVTRDQMASFLARGLGFGW